MTTPNNSLDRNKLAADLIKINKSIHSLSSKIEKSKDEIYALKGKQEEIQKLLKRDDDIDYSGKWVLSSQDPTNLFYYYIETASEAMLDDFFYVFRRCRIKVVIHIMSGQDGESIHIKRDFEANIYTDNVKIVTDEDIIPVVRSKIEQIVALSNSSLKCAMTLF